MLKVEDMKDCSLLTVSWVNIHNTLHRLLGFASEINVCVSVSDSLCYSINICTS